MANPPPPYDNITGISRAVMKDNAQETIGDYNGVARPSELVVDQLTQNVYVGNTNGNLNLVAYGSGVTNITSFDPQFRDVANTFAGGTATASYVIQGRSTSTGCLMQTATGKSKSIHCWDRQGNLILSVAKISDSSKINIYMYKAQWTLYYITGCGRAASKGVCNVAKLWVK